MQEYKVKGEARQQRTAVARYKPQGGVSRTILAQSGPHAGKAMVKAMAKVRVSTTVKGGK